VLCGQAGTESHGRVADKSQKASSCVDFRREDQVMLSLTHSARMLILRRINLWWPNKVHRWIT
jgi:hypothetical protein